MKISDSVEEMIFSEKAPAFNADEIRKISLYKSTD